MPALGNNLLSEVKVVTALAYTSGTAARNGAEVDMAEWEGVVAICHCATIAASAVGDIHWEQDTVTGMGSAADLLGTAIAIAADDDDQIFVSELHRPRERYVRIVVTKNGANAQAETVHYLMYGSRKGPVTNTVADLVTAEIHASPAEGTK